jgi:hypothetical protein
VLGADAKTRAAELAPCSDSPAGEACAQSFIESFGARAYRRALTTEEVDGLLGVYRVGAEGETYADGIGLVVEALLQSTGFLYETEIGDGTAFDPIILAPHELSARAHVVGRRPTRSLQAAAAVASRRPRPRGRAWRLGKAAIPCAASRIARVARRHSHHETAKDTTVYGSFETLKPSIVSEVDGFVGEVIGNSTGISADTGADWTVADSMLASQFYGVRAVARAACRSRNRTPGILNQGISLRLRPRLGARTGVPRRGHPAPSCLRRARLATDLNIAT